jgi:hypothetical protein
MNGDLRDDRPPRIAQKLVELRVGSSSPAMMASISVEVTSVIMPMPNARGGYDQVLFRYSGAVNEDAVEIWIPDVDGVD